LEPTSPLPGCNTGQDDDNQLIPVPMSQSRDIPLVEIAHAEHNGTVIDASGLSHHGEFVEYWRDEFYNEGFSDEDNRSQDIHEGHVSEERSGMALRIGVSPPAAKKAADSQISC
jgi:hypothetical protein